MEDKKRYITKEELLKDTKVDNSEITLVGVLLFIWFMPTAVLFLLQLIPVFLVYLIILAIKERKK